MVINSVVGKEGFRLTQNITLIGPPGSGKGYYGRLLAASWRQVPLYSASRILASAAVHRKDWQEQLNSGTLVDCAMVSNTILDFLQQQQHQRRTTTTNNNEHFLMDGFPRTPQQIQYMIEEWPVAYHITHAIHLKIPDHVCQAKMMGRRVCSLCHGEPNSAHVEEEENGFHLPPTRPPHCTNQCQPERHWQKRVDDVDATIVQKRLKEYRYYEQALLEYYSRRRTSGTTTASTGSNHSKLSTPPEDGDALPYVCSITPYRGIIDFPDVQRSLEHWLQQPPS